MSDVFSQLYFSFYDRIPSFFVILIYKFSPLANVRLFRRIRKNDTLFLKICAFREHSLNLCVVRGNVVNYMENLQIIPLGNVCVFRRNCRNDTPFLETCVFFAEFAGIIVVSGSSMLQRPYPWGNP